jgi:hypothetical protein
MRAFSTTWDPASGTSGSTVLATADAGKRWVIGGSYDVVVAVTGDNMTAFGFRFTLGNDSTVDMSLGSAVAGTSLDVNGFLAPNASFDSAYIKKIEAYYTGIGGCNINATTVALQWIEL